MSKFKKQKEFLNKLADLCEEYNAEFSYTTSDDGIHIDVDGKTVFVDYMLNAPAELRSWAKLIKEV